MVENIIFFIVFTLLLTIAIWVYINKKYSDNEKKFLFWVSIGSFWIRAILVLATIIIPRLLIPSDAGAYESTGLKLMGFIKQGILFPKLDDLSNTNFSYYYFNAVIYLIFGFHPVIIRLINCAIGVLASIFLYDVCKSVKGIRCAKIAFTLIGFMPSLIFYSSLNLKDTLIMFLIVLIIDIFVKMTKSTSIKHIVGILTLVLLMFTLRFYIGIIAMGVFIILLASVIKIPLRKKLIIISCLLTVCVFLPALTGYGFMGSRILSSYFNFDFFNNNRITLQEKSPDAASNIFLDVRFNNLFDVLKFLPIGLIYFMFAPFPWSVKGILQLATMPENIIWYLLFLVFAIPGVRYFISNKDKHKIGLILLAFCSVITVLYALSLSNLGIAYRMKFQVLPFWFIVLAVGMDIRFEKIREKRIFKFLKS